LERAQANLPAVQLRQERYKQALENKAVSQQDYDDASAALKQAQADIQYYQAMLDTAQINLNYSKVISPLTGRIGTSSVTDGATVTAYQPVPLATVQQLDPIYVDVPQSTSEMMRLRKRFQEGLLTRDQEVISQVELILDDGSIYKHKGTLQFRDISVDPTTSTTILRIIFPNP
jgi:membrane fusion protein (multidrug efflux system)